jgi:L,D-transpeptidase ErfK/SrfK
MKRSSARSFCAILIFGILAGCSSLNRSVQQPEQPVAPVTVPPIISDRFLLQSPEQRVVGELQIIETRDEDTFVDIARAYNLGFDELVDANPDIDPWMPGEGTRILLPTRFVLPDAPRQGIVVNLASKRLFYYPEPDAEGMQAVVSFPIGIGQTGSATPVGETTVTSKGKDPVWFPPASIRREYAEAGNPLPSQVMPGPDNPLGAHVLVLGMPSYLLHGTNRPAGVGMRVSHGCVRLFPENIQHLYESVPVDTPVTIVNQPLLLAWDDQRLYLEAHQPLVEDDRNWRKALPQMLHAAVADAPNGSALPDFDRVAAVLAAAQGVPVPVLTGAPDVEQIISTASIVHNLVILPDVEPEIMAHEIAFETGYEMTYEPAFD